MIMKMITMKIPFVLVAALSLSSLLIVLQQVQVVTADITSRDKYTADITASDKYASLTSDDKTFAFGSLLAPDNDPEKPRILIEYNNLKFLRFATDDDNDNDECCCDCSSRRQGK